MQDFYFKKNGMCSEPHFDHDYLPGSIFWVEMQENEHKENIASCYTEEAWGRLINDLGSTGQAATEEWPKGLCRGCPLFLVRARLYLVQDKIP